MISIIVPVYNSAERLPRCVESVRAQTYEDWELILIDDGSRDRSFELCEAYAAEDLRIRAFTQPNRGVSATRNRGLSLARGRYLQFLDSDDSIDPEMLQKLHDAMEENKADMVICGCLERSAEGERPVVPEIRRTVELSALGSAYPGIFANPLLNSPCTKLYKKDTIGTTAFPEELSMGEDLLFNLTVLRRCSRICFLDEALYLYEKQSGGLSSRERMDTADIARRIYLACREFARDYGFGSLAEQQISTTFVQFFCYGISSIYRSPKLSPDAKRKKLRAWARDPDLRRALNAAKMPQLKQQVVQTLMKCRLTPVLHLMLLAKS